MVIKHIILDNITIFMIILDGKACILILLFYHTSCYYNDLNRYIVFLNFISILVLNLSDEDSVREFDL